MSIRSITIAFGLSLGILAPAANAATITVYATADIYSAGGNRVPLPGATTPTIALPNGLDRSITLAFTGGNVSWNSGQTDFNPDSRELPSNFSGIYDPINSLSGISGTRRWFTVYGVFLSDELPSSSPSNLNYAPGEGTYTVTSAQASPVLGQVFFIGDGYTGLVDGSGLVSSTGTLQEFFIPDGATRLYLGFVDDMWIDNSGFYTYDYAIVPESGTLGLLAFGGLAGFLLHRRQRGAGASQQI